MLPIDMEPLPFFPFRRNQIGFPTFSCNHDEAYYHQKWVYLKKRANKQLKKMDACISTCDNVKQEITLNVLYLWWDAKARPPRNCRSQASKRAVTVIINKCASSVTAVKLIWKLEPLVAIVVLLWKAWDLLVQKRVVIYYQALPR